MRVLVIAGRELRALFLSPLAWVVLAVVTFIVAYLFFIQLELFLLLQPRLRALEGAPGVTDLVVAPTLGNIAVVVLLVVPLLTMRLISEEQRSGSLNLLLSAPVSSFEIVLGKYAGVVGFLLVLMILIAAIPGSLLMATALDLGKLAAGLLALVLLLASFAAVGLYMSALSPQPTVAGISTFGTLLLLWIIDWAGQSEAQASGLFAYLSMLRHFQPLVTGLVNSADVAYFLLLTVTFLGLSVRHLEGRRLGH